MDSSVLDVAELSVLLVDDSLTARNHIAACCNASALSASAEAINGQEAVPLLDTTLFDLVVTDYNMPPWTASNWWNTSASTASQPSVPI